MDADDGRVRALELLKATIEFPCEYAISIIVRNEPDVVTAVRAAAEQGLAAPLSGDAYVEVPSRAGKYLSLRLRVPCADAVAVLELHARVKVVPGVIQVL
jgi:putative lipoic acid-binding regulatory protein